MILKVALQLALALTALLTAYLDYKWHDKRTTEFKRGRSLLLSSLVLISIAGLINLYFDDIEKRSLKADKIQAEKKLDSMRYSVSNLSILDELSGDAKYYVRIAADTKKENLEKYKNRIYNMFQGAQNSNHVRILEMDNSNYELVFGYGLDLSAAEVFQRLANSHRFPPDAQIAQIKRVIN